MRQCVRVPGGLGVLWVLTVCVLVLCVAPAAPHPQCLDFKPPFRPLRELQFCVMYKEFGCCDYEKDQQLRAKYYRIMDNFDYYGYANCAGFVLEMICQVGQRSPSRSSPSPPVVRAKSNTHSNTHKNTHSNTHSKTHSNTHSNTHNTLTLRAVTGIGFMNHELLKLLELASNYT